jgi:hypothetical protein
MREKLKKKKNQKKKPKTLYHTLIEDEVYHYLTGITIL